MAHFPLKASSLLFLFFGRKKLMFSKQLFLMEEQSLANCTRSPKSPHLNQEQLAVCGGRGDDQLIKAASLALLLTAVFCAVTETL
jgi:hypothetical protein